MAESIIIPNALLITFFVFLFTSSILCFFYLRFTYYILLITFLVSCFLFFVSCFLVFYSPARIKLAEFPYEEAVTVRSPRLRLP